MSDREIETRLDRLEERLAWFERHATEQDKAMLALTEQCDRLRAELAALRERARDNTLGSTAPEAGDERPPHY